MIKPKLISLLKTTLGNQRVYGQVPDESAVKPCFHVYELYLHSHLLWSNRQVKSPLNRAKGKNNKGGEWAYPIPATW